MTGNVILLAFGAARAQGLPVLAAALVIALAAVQLRFGHYGQWTAAGAMVCGSRRRSVEWHALWKSRAGTRTAPPAATL